MNDAFIDKSSICRAYEPHMCILCSGAISIGDTYIRSTTRTPETHYLHLHVNCFDLVKTFLKYNPASDLSPISIREWIIDNVCESCNDVDVCCLDKFSCKHVHDVLIC